MSSNRHAVNLRKVTSHIGGDENHLRKAGGLKPIGGGGSLRNPTAFNYGVSNDLPYALLIAEIELRALEILLGSDLKELLAGKPSNP
jgi:hypothetical protein